ncbi:hypothetical protein [Nocardioides sp. AX2bis]|uniref:hypothetical protein n=1 Tax=Nocardioides sp. AX2bis TaxID=2653157 RepID=UPI0012F1172B|nr:hypothetical protein [Nocardioides sp. AX2bis]VXC22035.1 conserved hypothetical protein [Nocardioides sp. AX2bis]
MSSLVRGPLSPGVYWRRRLVVLAVLLLLVVVVLRALGGGGDEPGAATTVADDTAATAPDAPLPSAGPTMSATDQAEVDAADAQRAEAEAAAEAEEAAERAAERAAREAATAPLAEPEGRCSDADVVVTPVVEGAVAGSDVSVLLNLRTVATEACTWQTGPAHLTVKITSGDDDVWSSQQCPGRLTRSTLTVRADSTTTTSLVWDAKRSAEDCPGTTPYAAPGYYHVVASSLGGEPNDVQFELVDPRDIVADQAQAQESADQADAEEQKAARQDRRDAAQD